MATKAERLEFEREAVTNLERALRTLDEHGTRGADEQQARREYEAALIRRRARLARLEGQR